MVRIVAAMLVVMVVAGCGAEYRAGGPSPRVLPQNMPSNSAPEAPGSRPR